MSVFRFVRGRCFVLTSDLCCGRSFLPVISIVGVSFVFFERYIAGPAVRIRELEMFCNGLPWRLWVFLQ